MAKEDLIECTGTVIELLRGENFKVQLTQGNAIVNCKISGKIRRHKIRILPGDSVKIEMNAFDLTQGRIIHRQRFTK